MHKNLCCLRTPSACLSKTRNCCELLPLRSEARSCVNPGMKFLLIAKRCRELFGILTGLKNQSFAVIAAPIITSRANGLLLHYRSLGLMLVICVIASFAEANNGLSVTGFAPNTAYTLSGLDRPNAFHNYSNTANWYCTDCSWRIGTSESESDSFSFVTDGSGNYYLAPITNWTSDCTRLWVQDAGSGAGMAEGINYTWSSTGFIWCGVGPNTDPTFTITGDYAGSSTAAGPYTKPCDRKSGGDGGCKSCDSQGMARYTAHSMLASLNIEDTPIGYTPPRGPAINFTVTYNQRDTQQPQTFSYSNLGPKWTFNWLSYVTDDPNNASANALVFVPGGGAETYSGFDSGSQSYLPDPQSHAVLVRTSPAGYEKRFPDGSKQIFNLGDGATSYPRKIFMTQTIDSAGNSVTINYDSTFRITAITDALGQVTTLSYELSGDPLKITKVAEPFPTGRSATFTYTNGQLTTITDEIGIQSIFTYAADGTNFISSLQTPYGTTNFSTGQSGTNKWIEMTDPLGGKERVEYRDSAPGINATDAAGTVPAGFTNSGLDVANTFYWDKKAIEMYPPVNGVYDYTKARITHWAYNSDGTVSGIAASIKSLLRLEQMQARRHCNLA